MNYIITYEPDGSIISSSMGEATLSDVIEGSGELAIQVDDIYDPEQYYVDLTSLTPVARTAITANTALSTPVSVAATLSGLPNCTVQYFQGVNTEGSATAPPPILATDSVTDGVLNVSSDLAGEYSIVLTAPTYLDTTVVLTVQE